MNKWPDSLDVSEKKHEAHAVNRTPKAPSPKKSTESNVVAEWLPIRLQNFLSSFLPKTTKSHEYNKQGAPPEFFHGRTWGGVP
jgi:hypothetical protein